jgi:uncharacterized phage-associated protein
MVHFNFNQDKAINALLLILNELRQSDFHKLFKILYFADRKHLKRYGNPIIGDEYISMENGPVPSNIYDLLKFANNRTTFSPFKEFFGQYSSTVNVQSYMVTATKNSNIDYLSETDIECLMESIHENKDLNFKQLKDKSHDLAWKRPDPQLNTIDFLKMAEAEGADKTTLHYISENSENMVLF